MRMQEGQRSHASPSAGVRQFKDLAISSAKSFLPTPSSPANSSAPGTRPIASIRLKISLTRWFPTKLENISKCRSQNPEFRMERAASHIYRFSFILTSDSWLLDSAFPGTESQPQARDCEFR